jgi:hypothetical protein
MSNQTKEVVNATLNLEIVSEMVRILKNSNEHMTPGILNKSVTWHYLAASKRFDNRQFNKYNVEQYYKEAVKKFLSR